MRDWLDLILIYFLLLPLDIDWSTFMILVGHGNVLRLVFLNIMECYVLTDGLLGVYDDIFLCDLALILLTVHLFQYYIKLYSVILNYYHIFNFYSFGSIITTVQFLHFINLHLRLELVHFMVFELILIFRLILNRHSCRPAWILFCSFFYHLLEDILGIFCILALSNLRTEHHLQIFYIIIQLHSRFS